MRRKLAVLLSATIFAAQALVLPVFAEDDLVLTFFKQDSTNVGY